MNKSVVIVMNLKERLKEYVAQFNMNDVEYIKTDISNDEVFEFLSSEIPLIEIPDKEIERTYYFRYWVFRKHIKNTPHGHIVTEFLPRVDWAGAYNSINCATPFHLLEGRWLKNTTFLEEYIDFFLDNIGDAFFYSMAFVWAIVSYAELNARECFVQERYEKIKAWYEERLKRTPEINGLYYSVDGRDGMEFSISGSGLRPTMNSYIYADSLALAKIARQLKKIDDAEKYEAFANDLRKCILDSLWDGDFFVTIPDCCQEDFKNGSITHSDEHHVRELIGYIPWMYDIPNESNETAWNYLLDKNCFYTKFGITTADQSHERYMEKISHECLWNGPIWPFATSQVLCALAKCKQNRKEFFISNEEYLMILHDYAVSQKLKLDNGKTVDWIDENKSPVDGYWLARENLKNQGFPVEKGGIERGKDYNHSLFGDIVLSGLLGISFADGKININPLIPESWTYFKVENLNVGGKKYNINFTKETGIAIDEL